MNNEQCPLKLKEKETSMGLTCPVFTSVVYLGV